MTLINPIYPLNIADLNGVTDPNLKRFLLNLRLNIININSRAINSDNLDSGILAAINSVPVPITFTETNYTPAYEDQSIEVDSTAGIVNIDLPEEPDVPEGWCILIFDIGTATSNDVTITPPTGGEIDNAGTNTAITLNTNFSSVLLKHIGSGNYRIIFSRNY